MKYFLLLLSFLIFNNYCFAEKVIQVYRFKKDSTISSYELKENQDVKIRLVKPVTKSFFSSLNVAGKVERIDDSSIVVDDKVIFYKNIEDIYFKISQRKIRTERIIGYVLVVPFLASVGTFILGSIVNTNDQNSQTGSMEGFVIMLYGALGSACLCPWNPQILFSDKSHFGLDNDALSLNKRWFLRVVKR